MHMYIICMCVCVSLGVWDDDWAWKIDLLQDFEQQCYFLTRAGPPALVIIFACKVPFLFEFIQFFLDKSMGGAPPRHAPATSFDCPGTGDMVRYVGIGNYNSHNHGYKRL